MTGGQLNLSLLSRGVGEVHKNGHEKVEVFLEPEDYHNFSKNPDRFYLPPIHTSYPSFLDTSPSFTARSSREAHEFRVPKTFTTRKGALLLFSEDLAQSNTTRGSRRKTPHPSHYSSITPSASLDSQVDLKTVEDLAKSILKYGSEDRPDDKIYLKFVHARRDNFGPQIRPGFSAKRYLSTWTRTWDDTVFDNVIKHGYITERSFYHYNLIVPNLRRRLFHEDLSHMPQPYRLMRTMLMAPGSLSGYTFYRSPTNKFIEEDEQEEEELQVRKKLDHLRNIRVVKTKGGMQEEVMYAELDRQSQKEVITDLLVKSAVHYALQKQEEIYEESMFLAMQKEQEEFRGQAGLMVPPPQRVVTAHQFDMKEAVESLLDSQHGRLAIGADLPEIDDRSQYSDKAGSFKGSTLPSHLAKHHTQEDKTPSVEEELSDDSQRSSWPQEASESEKEYLNGVPVVAVRDGSVTSEASSHHSNVPQLPPIRHTLSPIHDVSRETTQPYISLPPIGRAAVEEADEDADRAGESETDREGRGRQKGDYSYSSGQSSEREKGKASSHAGDGGDSGQHFGGSSASGTTKTRPHWKRRGTGSQAESMKGSMIMAPDGEIISVGGSVVRGGGVPDVGNLSDIPSGHRPEGVATDESGASDDEPEEWKNAKKFSLSQKSDSLKRFHKREIDYTSGDIDATMSIHSWSYMPREHDLEFGIVHAASVRSLPGLQLEGAHKFKKTASQRSSVTEKDIMDTLTDHAQKIADNVLSQPLAGKDLEADVKDAIAEIMRNRRASSAAPSAAEYRDLIKKSLATAVAKAAGLDPDSISDDAEISPELLEALASQKLTPDQIEIVSDADGKTRIQSRSDARDSISGVQEGHLFIAPGKDDTGSIKRQVSIPADRVSVVDDVEVDRISYQGTDVMSEKGGEKKTGRSKAGSKAGSKPGSIAGGTMADLREVEGMMAELEGKVEQSPEQEDDFLKAVKQAQEEAEPSPPASKRTTSGKTTPSVAEEAPKSRKESSAAEPVEEQPPATLPGPDVTEKKPEDVQSQKSGKTGVSQKSEASKDSKKKGKKTPEEKEEPFVVGLVDHMDELKLLYGGKLPPAGAAATKGKPKEKKPKKEPLPPKKEEKKKKGAKKGKKGKKKEEEAAPVEEAPPPPAPEPAKEPTPPPKLEKEPTPRVPTPLTSEPKPSSPEMKTDESDGEFTFVRETSSPEIEVPQTRLQIPSPPIEEEKSDDENAEDEDAGIKAISNREARAAKRAAAAAKRREEVERRRREKEEQAKREKEEVERQVALQREMEEERRRREEERRLRKEQQKEAEERELRDREEYERRRRLEADREKKAKEDYQRKLEEMKRKQHEEEMRRHELMLQRQREEEERRQAEELMLSQMAEQERLEYERKKREEEEERLRKEMEERIRRAEEAKKAMEEAQRLAEEMARKQAELEARLKFNHALQLESNSLSHSQEINRAFVFSYYELLQWLGLDIPEFELAKLADY